MSYPSDVIRIARNEIGYHEKRTNDNLDKKTAPNDGAGNYTKYARDLDAISYFNGKKQGYDWCAVFYCWLIEQTLGDGMSARSALYQPNAKYNCGAGCTPQAQYYRENNAFYTAPKVGDQIFYGKTGDEAHTGLVIEVSDGSVYTIEGNVQNQVMLLAHSITDKSIVGYGRPRYEKDDPCAVYVVKKGDTLNKIAEMYDTTAEEIAKQNDISDPNVITVGTVLVFKKGDGQWHTNDIFCQYGDTGMAVKMLQALLLKRGLDLVYDGVFGAETRSAVMAWQQSQQITVDGIVGDETISTL